MLSCFADAALWIGDRHENRTKQYNAINPCSLERRHDRRPKSTAEGQAHLGDPNALEDGGQLRDLALFNLAINSKLRGCDVVKLRIADGMTGGAIRLRSTVVQQKTGRLVPFELTDPTCEALADWLKIRRAIGSDWVFPSRIYRCQATPRFTRCRATERLRGAR